MQQNHESSPIVGASAQAASGAEHIETPTHYDAILLAGFGGPEGQDDVIPFLRNVTHGRGIPEERLEEVAHHYRHFGGVSPINDHNRQLKAALEEELQRRGIDLPVLWGNRNWSPYLSEALDEAKERGFTSLIAIATSAYSSYSSCRQYREDLWGALESTGTHGEITIDKVRQFFDHPGFVTPFIEGVNEAVEAIEAQLEGAAVGGAGLASTVEVLFATHSIPTADAERSGPRDREFGDGGAYAAQHRAVAEVVMLAVEQSREQRRAANALDGDSAPFAPIPWQLVYQSRSGAPSTPWLEPDINDAIAELPAAGRSNVIVVPLGFVSDHMEVMWDLDNEARETAEEHGLGMIRVATPGTHRAYVAGLIDLVLERRDGVPAAERPALTAFGPWFDVCRPACCENARLGFKPALAGVAP